MVIKIKGKEPKHHRKDGIHTHLDGPKHGYMQRCNNRVIAVGKASDTLDLDFYPLATDCERVIIPCYSTKVY